MDRDKVLTVKVLNLPQGETGKALLGGLRCQAMTFRHPPVSRVQSPALQSDASIGLYMASGPAPNGTGLLFPVTGSGGRFSATFMRSDPGGHSMELAYR